MKILISIAAVAALALTGCNSSKQRDTGGTYHPVVVDLEGSREVTCVISDSGGIDCDWETAK